MMNDMKFEDGLNNLSVEIVDMGFCPPLVHTVLALGEELDNSEKDKPVPTRIIAKKVLWPLANNRDSKRDGVGDKWKIARLYRDAHIIHARQKCAYR